MAEISAEMIKDLRAKTSAGVLDCKKALVESEGDFEKAIDILRKSGAAKAEKKSGRIAAEGRVEIRQSADKAVVIEVNSETDFVAKNPEFQDFVGKLADTVLKNPISSVEQLLEFSLEGGSVRSVIQGLVGKIGENISLRRFQLLQVTGDEKIGSYTHPGNKIAVLVKVKDPKGKVQPEQIRDLAMHVAAASPQYLTKENIPSEKIEKEKEIYREQLKDSGKPAPVLDKIIEGKVAKFADEVCFVQQIFVKDPTGKLSITEYLKQIDSELKITDFIRYQVGEGVEKKESDFAAEVAKQLEQVK